MRGHTEKETERAVMEWGGDRARGGGDRHQSTDGSRINEVGGRRARGGGDGHTDRQTRQALMTWGVGATRSDPEGMIIYIYI